MKGLFVTIRDQGQVEIGLLALPDQTNRIIDNGQSLQTKKVKLDQTDLLNETHIELGYLPL